MRDINNLFTDFEKAQETVRETGVGIDAYSGVYGSVKDLRIERLREISKSFKDLAYTIDTLAGEVMKIKRGI